MLSKKSIDQIMIRGARTHNLQNINLDIPRNKLVVITGVSGSGKSSLAFDTLYAEGQRRYVESLSVYARQFLSVMEKPDVDTIEGLSPAIAIQQKATSHNPRSTVGTITEIYDYLRLLFARIGQPKCPKHNIILQAQTINQMVEQIMLLPENTKIMLLAPIILDRKGEHEKKLQDLIKLGFLRIRLDGNIQELNNLKNITLNQKQRHTIEVVIDRLNVNLQNKQRISDSIESTLKISPEVLVVHNVDQNKDLVFSAQFSCPHCGWSLTELEPRLFSFNSPHGACQTCSGLGNEQFMDPEKIIVDPNLSLNAGAIRGWDRNHQYYYGMLVGLAKHYDFSLSIPFKKLSQKIKNIILYGSNNEEISFELQYENFTPQKKQQTFPGVIAYFTKRYRETTSEALRDELAKLLSQQPCSTCNGSRLNSQARQVFIKDHSLPDITNMSISEASTFLQNLKLTGMREAIGNKILQEIKTRLKFLIDVGLEYLTIARSADTLSGGEAQRIRLASQIGSGLAGVMYVLDEPSIGLHQRDNAKLISTLLHLRDLGNSVIVVEHDHDTIMCADFVIDVGLGAGQHGGNIIATGTPQAIIKNKNSLTGQYLAKTKNIPIPTKRTPQGEHHIVIHNAKANNLKDITISLPIGLITCITGVSGSGKSTLINDTLWPIAAHKLNGAQISSKDALTKITGLEHLDKVIDITQDPIGRTPRSNPATYIGLFTEIRDLFAKTNAARAKGYNAGRFSFNVKDGRCPTCSGDGLIKIEMHFLPDVYVTCDACHGKRYSNETLEIHYKDKNINDILHMSVEEAQVFFSSHPTIKRKLDTLTDVGLNYITLGQSATTLSGGEAQRIKLAKELARKDTGNTLYILDEPTTGLHFQDISRLLLVLKTLRDRGNTIIIIEHNLDVIKIADWIVDLGPEGGDKGGNVVATGTPETIAKHKKSYTGKFLRDVL